MLFTTTRPLHMAFTTMESTSGGGVKFILPTLQTQLTFTKRLVFTARRPYCDSPTWAMSRLRPRLLGKEEIGGKRP